MDITPDTKGVIPREGSYGHGVIPGVASSYESRMPVRMIPGSNRGDIGARISTGAVRGMLGMVGSRLGGPAGRIPASLRRAPMLHMDETSHGASGTLYWVWITRNPGTGEAYFASKC